MFIKEKLQTWRNVFMCCWKIGKMTVWRARLNKWTGDICNRAIVCPPLPCTITISSKENLNDTLICTELHVKVLGPLGGYGYWQSGDQKGSSFNFRLSYAPLTLAASCTTTKCFFSFLFIVTLIVWVVIYLNLTPYWTSN